MSRVDMASRRPGATPSSKRQNSMNAAELRSHDVLAVTERRRPHRRGDANFPRTRTVEIQTALGAALRWRRAVGVGKSYGGTVAWNKSGAT